MWLCLSFRHVSFLRREQIQWNKNWHKLKPSDSGPSVRRSCRTKPQRPSLRLRFKLTFIYVTAARGSVRRVRLCKNKMSAFIARPVFLRCKCLCWGGTLVLYNKIIKSKNTETNTATWRKKMADRTKFSLDTETEEERRVGNNWRKNITAAVYPLKLSLKINIQIWGGNN